MVVGVSGAIWKLPGLMPTEKRQGVWVVPQGMAGSSLPHPGAWLEDAGDVAAGTSCLFPSHSSGFFHFLSLSLFFFFFFNDLDTFEEYWPDIL